MISIPSIISIPSSSSSSSSFLEISCCLPPGIEILSTKYGLGIFTTKFFKKNEVLYLGRYYNIKDTKEDQKIKLIIKKNKEKKEIEQQEQREEQEQQQQQQQEQEQQEQEREEEEEDNKEYLMTSEIHTVGIGYNDNKQRQVFTFDSFMNHSCDPNTFSADEHDDEYGGTYKTVALRDILPGEQITCDYDLFEYDSRNKGIEKCECGSSKCRGASLGFSFLPFNTQLELLNRAYPEVISAWLNDNPNILYREYTIPDGFALRKTNSGDLHLISTKEFSPNQLMHTYETEYFNSIKYDTVIIKIQTKLYNEDNQLIDSFSSASSNKFTNNNNNLIIHENLDTGSNISLDEEESETIHEISSNISHEEINPLFPNNINNNNINNNLDNSNNNINNNININSNNNNNNNNEFWHEPTYVIKNLDLITHTVNRDDNIRELFGWDTFCNHSCSPNSNFQYLTTTLTQTIALSKIKIGEMITCDYTLFDTELDGSEFICKCGSDNCKGIIKG